MVTSSIRVTEVASWPLVYRGTWSLWCKLVIEIVLLVVLKCRQNFDKNNTKDFHCLHENSHGQSNFAYFVLMSSPRVITSGTATRGHRPDVDTGAPVVRDPVASAGETRRGRGTVTIELRPRPGAWHRPRVVTRGHEVGAGLGCPLPGPGVPGGRGGCPAIAGVWHGDKDWTLVTRVISLTTLTGVRHSV